jgi:heptosyltransferase-1
MKQRAEAQVDLWRTAAKKRGGEEVIGVIPSASMPIKSYPDSRWAEALRRIWDEHRALPVLLGGPSDVASLDALASALVAAGVPFQRLAAPLGILDMAALVTALDGVLSVDTGLTHLSVAQGVPTIVLVTGGNPGRFFPWPNARHHIVLNVAMTCSGCHDRCTRSEAECITHIPPEDIAAAYAQLKGRRVSLDVMIAPPPKTKKPLQQAG